MEPQGEETGSRFDTVLLVVALVLLIGGIAAYYVLDPQLSKLPRLALLVGGIAAAVALIYRTVLGREIWTALVGSRAELRKVVWPTRQETLQTTLVIAIFVVFMALVMWGLDSALLFGVHKITGGSA